MSSSSEGALRLLFLGDVVGCSGREAVNSRLPGLRKAWGLDFVVVNAENAAGGFGITEAICQELLEAGADCVTLGNHAFDQREALAYIERQPRLLRPINYPSGTPGRGAVRNRRRLGAAPRSGAPALPIARETGFCPSSAGRFGRSETRERRSGTRGTILQGVISLSYATVEQE